MGRHWKRGRRRSGIPVFEIGVLIAVLAYLYRDSFGLILIRIIWVGIFLLLLAGIVLWLKSSARLKSDDQPFSQNSDGKRSKPERDLYHFWKSSRDESSARTPTTWSLELLRSLEWKRFEEVAAALYRLQGYEAKTTRTGADGGVDIVLYHNAQSEPFSVMQCKSWNSRQIGVKPVRELLGVMTHQKVKQGIFITTSEFSREAREFATGNNLTLVDGTDFLSKIRSLNSGQQQALLKTATIGDYTTPTCPRCDIKMNLKKGDGYRPFWGCPNYPRCSQKFFNANTVEGAAA